jgi:hypothetical protein
VKKPKDEHSYFFVDESGDPTFYDARGNLIVGAERGTRKFTPPDDWLHLKHKTLELCDDPF